MPLAIRRPVPLRRGRRRRGTSSYSSLRGRPRRRQLGAELDLHAARGVRDRRAARKRAVARRRSRDEIVARARAASSGSSAAVVPSVPADLADHLRENGIELTPDRDALRRAPALKTDAELAGIRRAQGGRGRDGTRRATCSRRAEPNGDGGLVLDGEPLTCERVKAAIDAGVHRRTARRATTSSSRTARRRRSATTWARARSRAGEPIVIDLFPRDDESACFADMTRTFVVGEPSEELAECHRLCQEALDLVARRDQAGRDRHASCTTVACDVFEEARLPDAAVEAAGRGARGRLLPRRSATASASRCTRQPWLGLTRPTASSSPATWSRSSPGLYRHGYGGCPAGGPRARHRRRRRDR